MAEILQNPRMKIDPLYAVFHHWFQPSTVSISGIHFKLRGCWCKFNDSNSSFSTFSTHPENQQVEPENGHLGRFQIPNLETLHLNGSMLGFVRGLNFKPSRSTVDSTDRMQWAGPPGLHALHGYTDQVHWIYLKMERSPASIFPERFFLGNNFLE